ncbi:MAG: hypothetical protein R3230_00660 [Nitrosopumilaceae archaeon]|nr:hypothetical protein [Nitrosopumilaceae archaeon]
MSTVKSDNFAPFTQPIVLINGFNDVESFVVGSGQTSFTSTKFTNKTQIRAFKRNDLDPTIWDELTVTFTSTDTFEVAESYSEGDEILLYGIGNYYQGDPSLSSDEVSNDSTNSEFTSSTSLTDIIDALGASSKLESYKDYGVGSTNLQSVDLTQSETVASGFYNLIDTGYSGILIQMNDSTTIKQVYLPFGKEGIYSRDNSSGSFPSDFTPIGNVDVVSETTSFTLSNSHVHKYVRVSNAGAVNVTIPDSVSLDFPIGTIFTITQSGVGQVTFDAGTGVVINSADSLVSTRVQYSSATLTKVGTDEWDLVGDLA